MNFYCVSVCLDVDLYVQHHKVDLMQFFPPPECGASMEVCVYVGGVGIQREQILYFSGGGAVLLGEVLRFSSFYSIDCWC